MSLAEEFKVLENECTVLYDEPMSRHTTLRIGGPADVFIIPRTQAQIIAAAERAKALGTELYIIGNGSNLLVADKGIHGVVIAICDGMRGYTIEGNTAVARAGTPLAALARATAEAGLTGMECAGGIPGTVGGGLSMNAGAYGGELKDTALWADVLDNQLKMRRIYRDDMQLSYRHSAFMEQGLIILEAAFSYKEANPADCLATIDDFNARRRDKQPLNLPSAGSAFKRPQGDFAARLIDVSGLKGTSQGAAQVSPKHAGFIVNNGGATAEDVLILIDKIIETVYRDHGVTLEPEIRIIGKR